VAEYLGKKFAAEVFNAIFQVLTESLKTWVFGMLRLDDLKHITDLSVAMCPSETSVTIR